MAKSEVYDSLIQRKGFAYTDDKIKDDVTHYRDPIDATAGRPAGNSHIAGDASPEVQSRAIDALIEASQRAGLSTRETAYVLAIARLESGFNPDAAAGPTSAYGLGQFVDKTGRAYGITDANRGDLTKQAEALVAHFEDNAKLASDRGQSDEYIYKYHHDGPALDYGGLGISQKNVMPYVDSYEKFVEDYEKKYDKLPVDPTFNARNRPANEQASPGHSAIRQGAHSAEVGELQSQLNQLGYTDSQGNALSIDERFGSGTKAAVQSFQRDHGLKDDGIVGPATQKAIKEQVESQTQSASQGQPSMRLDDSAHPDYLFFQQARDHVYRLDREMGRTPDHMSDNLASALAVQARAGGLQRIDQIALGPDGSRLWAVQTPPGRTDHFFDRQTSIPTASVNVSMEQSAAQWPQAMQQFREAQQQTHEQAQTQSHQQTNPEPQMGR